MNKPIVVSKNPNGEQFLIRTGNYYALLNKYGDLPPAGVSSWKDESLYHKCLLNGFEDVVPFEYEGDKISKADNSHLSDSMERFSYITTTNYNTIYIPVNRLKMVYQTEESLEPKKVNENYWKMKNNVPLNPVWIGYDYDVHDGHHRLEAAKRLNYSHVPCKVVGKDAKKVADAIKEYRKLWKSVYGGDSEWSFI